ncbi:MAG: BppU family phage baseplate upper protein [Promethearchaeota archaeon]
MSSPQIDIYIGDVEAYDFELTKNGIPFDLTGSTVYITVKERLEDPDSNALIQKTQTTHVDPVNGITSFTFTSADTNFNPGIYFYDIQVKDTGDEISTFKVGKFNLRLIDERRPRKIKKGDTVEFNITVRDDDGNPINITGFTFIFTLTLNGLNEDISPIIQITETTHIDPINGITRITIPSSQTDTLNIGDYIFSIRFVDIGGSQKTLDRSNFIVQGDVTRTTS